jgi:hypothetical protein
VFALAPIGAKANTAVTTIVDVNREKQFDD